MSTSKKIASDCGSSAEVMDSTESLGAWLARTRVSLGAEPRDMARHLGLNPTIILALEADDFTRLGPPVFVRGYLSRYARWLDLSEAAVLERYRQQSGPGQEPPPLKVIHSRQRQIRVRDLRGIVYLLVVIGLGWTAIQHLGDLDPGRLLTWWPRSQQANTPSSANKPMAANTQTQYPFQTRPEEATREPPPPPPAPAASEPPPAPSPEPASISASTIVLAPPTTAPAPDAGGVGTTPALTAAAPGETGDSSAPDTRSGARLMLQFSDDCWVEVKDAQGKVLVNGLMKANTTRDLSGAAPFTVTLGNAPAARIALDDRPVDTAVYVPRRGTVSRFTLNSQP